MSQEVELANQWQIEWVLPVPITGQYEKVNGRFAFDPFHNADKMFGRFIQIKSMDILGEYFVTINKLERRYYISDFLIHYKKRGSMYSVMREVQEDMTAQAIQYVMENSGGEKGSQRRD